MNKIKSKKMPYDSKKALAIKHCARLFNCSPTYVRICIKPNSKREDILKAFQKKYSELNQILPNN